VSPSEAQTGRCLAVRQAAVSLRQASLVAASFRRSPTPLLRSLHNTVTL